MATPLMVEAHIILLGRLYQLRLVHDMPNLFFEETVGHSTTRCHASMIRIIHQIGRLHCRSVWVILRALLLAGS